MTFVPKEDPEGRSRRKIPKEDPEGKHSSLKNILMNILIHPFSRREPKRLLVPRVEKTESSESFDYDFILLNYFL